MLHRKNLFLALAGALSVLLMFAACGGGDDDDNSGDDGGSSETARATGTAESTDDSGDDSGDGTETPTDDSGGSDGGGDAPEDVCALLTKDEVDRALGGSSGNGEAETNDPFFSCRWETEEFESVSVELLKGPKEDREFYYSLTTDPEKITGMGNKAQYTDLVGLEVITDHYVVTVSVTDFDQDDAEVRDLVLGLGDRVLNRLND